MHHYHMARSYNSTSYRFKSLWSYARIRTDTHYPTRTTTANGLNREEVVRLEVSSFLTNPSIVSSIAVSRSRSVKEVNSHRGGYYLLRLIDFRSPNDLHLIHFLIDNFVINSIFANSQYP